MVNVGRGLLAAAAGLLLINAVPGSSPQRAGAAAAAPQALAYVTNGQVQVFEAGSLTTVGPGQNPVWSPSGSNLLFVHPDFVADTADLFVADSHGANVRAVGSGAYPYIQPSWSRDGKSIVYAELKPGTKTSAASLPLEIRALDPVSKTQRVLATVTIAGGCTQAGTALQVAATVAEGSYRGMASTLIWARPDLLVVQASCTGSGLLFVPLKGKATLYAGWSGGVLSPDGTTVAAVVAAAKGKAAQLGLLSLAGMKSTTLQPQINASVLAWTLDGSALLAISEPANTANGTSQVSLVSRNGKTVVSLGAVPGTGVYHPSVDRTGKSLAVAVIASATAKVGVIPSTTIDLLSTQQAIPAHAFFVGSEPAWRP